MTSFLAGLLEFLAKTAPYWGLLGGAFLASFLLTPVCRALAVRLGMVDQPSERRINTTPVPRGGGLAVYLAVAAALYVGTDVFELISIPTVSVQHRLCALAGALCLLGLADDKFSLPPLAKLAGQVAVALGAHFWGGVGFQCHFPALAGWLDATFTVFWIVGAINAFNLIDGLDGLATGLASIAAFGMAGALFFSGMPENTLVYFAFLGACLGFLRYNFHPASVFLGDTGSMFIGFSLATMPLVAGGSHSLFVSLGVPLLAMGVPIFDTALAIFRRIVRALLHRMVGTDAGNAHVMAADTDHLHHRILRRFVSQRKAALGLYALAFFFVSLALGGLLLKGRAVALYIVGFMVGATILFRDMRRIELWDMGRLLGAVAHERSVASRRRRHLLRTPLLLLADVFVLVLAWVLASLALSVPITAQAVRRWMALRAIPVFLCLVAFRAYMTVWSRAMLSNYVRLAMAIVVGTGLTAAGTVLAGLPHSHLFVFSCLYAALTFIGLVSVRMVRAVVRDLFYAIDSGRLRDQPDVVRIVAYGAGLRYRMFRRELVRSSGSSENRRVIVGLLDDDTLLRNQYVGGIRIYGTLEQAPDVLKRLRADAVVITCRLTPERRTVARKMFAACGIPVTEWVCSEISIERNENGDILA